MSCDLDVINKLLLNFCDLVDSFEAGILSYQQWSAIVEVFFVISTAESSGL